jgi:hypothetical protein
MKFTLPVRTQTESNCNEHWRTRHRRSKAQREVTAAVLADIKAPQPPCVVTITRVSKGVMDDDNLASSAKHIRDQIAVWIGVDDKHRDIVRYVYEQRRGKEFALEVEIRPMEVVK